MNWIVKADFPTPPPPTTTSLYSVKSLEAAIAPAGHITHQLTHLTTPKMVVGHPRPAARDSIPPQPNQR